MPETGLSLYRICAVPVTSMTKGQAFSFETPDGGREVDVFHPHGLFLG